MDGLKLNLDNSLDTETQSCFYNGLTHNKYGTNVFVFFSDGTICAIYINGKGCVHDSNMSKIGGLYDKCEKLSEKFGVRRVVDSACTSKNIEHIIRSAKKTPKTGLPEDIVIYRGATSVRQLSEWVMRSL